MRICIISSFPPQRCGVGDYTESLSKSMLGVRHDLEVVILAQRSLRDLPEEEKYREGLTVLRIWKKDVMLPLRLMSAIGRLRPDVVHIQHEFTMYGGHLGLRILPLLLYLKLRKLPTVVTIHTIWTLSRLEEVRPHAGKIKVKASKLAFKWVTKLIAACASKIHVLNPVAVNLPKEYGVPEEKVIFTHFGIDKPTLYNLEDAKRRLGYGKKVILMLFGFAFPSKGYEYAIQAMPEIIKKHPETILAIIGGNDPKQDPTSAIKSTLYINRLKALVEKLELAKQVTFTNQITNEDIPLYFSAADIVIFPYLPKSGIASTFYKAASYGKPVVVTDIDCFCEVVNKVNGLVVPTRNPKAIVKAVCQLIEDVQLRERLGRNIRNMVTKEWSWDNIAEKTLALYDDIKS